MTSPLYQPAALYNIKVFRENRSWPHILAVTLAPLRVYDMWLVADYAPASSEEAGDE